MSEFVQIDPSLDAYWRAIILFGKNSASYKFALAHALLEIAEESRSLVTLEDLAKPYTRHLLSHLVTADRQGTAASSRFLDACRASLRDDISEAELLETTIRLGFVNVLDAFHNVNQAESPVRFFMDARQERGGIELTDELFQLQEEFQAQNLPHEVEARWRLVETAWSLNMSPHLLMVNYTSDGGLLFVESDQNKRVDITSCREALSGYQKGKCFYCFSDMNIASTGEYGADVDHFFPHVLLNHDWPRHINIDGVWNLVLSCQACNRGANGKFARVPDVKYLKRLHRRNNYLIDSHHPLRETLIEQTGRKASARAQFLQAIDQFAIKKLIHRWRAVDEQPTVF